MMTMSFYVTYAVDVRKQAKGILMAKPNIYHRCFKLLAVIPRRILPSWPSS